MNPTTTPTLRRPSKVVATKRLTRAKQHAFVMARIRGLDITASCKEASFSKDTYYAHRDLLDAQVNTLVDEITEHAKTALKSASVLAATALIRNLNAQGTAVTKSGDVVTFEDGKTQVAAADSILDRSGLKAPDKHELTGKDGGPVSVLALLGLLNAKRDN